MDEKCITRCLPIILGLLTKRYKFVILKLNILKYSNDEIIVVILKMTITMTAIFAITETPPLELLGKDSTRSLNLRVRAVTILGALLFLESLGAPDNFQSVSRYINIMSLHDNQVETWILRSNNFMSKLYIYCSCNDR